LRGELGDGAKTGTSPDTVRTNKARKSLLVVLRSLSFGCVNR
jgi:hypothetical protein